MIYVSTGQFRNVGIRQAVLFLAKNGIKNIELSGGEHDAGLSKDLLFLKKKYSLKFLCHNYFPVPKRPFVLNLASFNEQIFLRTINFIKKAVSLSKKLGAEKYGFHAGFFYDISAKEIGRRLRKNVLSDRGQTIDRFCQGYRQIMRHADDIEVYVENNVISIDNLKEFNGKNPAMLSSLQDYRELRKKINFKLLLDIGHLKVSARALKKDFMHEFQALSRVSDYFHISDNNGRSDDHLSFGPHSDLFFILKKLNLDKKTVTLEIVGAGKIRDVYDLMKRCE